MQNTDLLVISAHSADYVWRSGGVIAKYVKMGKSVQVVALSFGERGESAELWKSGKFLQEIKEIRRDESMQAAEVLGAPIQFYDWDDYPLKIDENRILELVKLLRTLRPINILTHGDHDPFNTDHEATASAVHKASILAIANGVLPEIPVCKQPRLFGFEHHQSELSEFYPDVIIDITEVYDTKKKAMDCFQTQKHLIEYYAERAFIRGNHARRISGVNEYKFAEAFTRKYPYVGGEFL
ncbi:MAG: PIG-L family deacetylase [Thermoplasmatales archaeon]|nr:PIG-L family deacetylase [Candidatus Thermoplasmatota archaeon]MCL6002535.1 PIG-L family deacetylase [Candidatus Thermoplasmatota archaeon]MDA8054817.1 PIG-L family deacetylase [Thermoplasmatales archaeon]